MPGPAAARLRPVQTGAPAPYPGLRPHRALGVAAEPCPDRLDGLGLRHVEAGLGNFASHDFCGCFYAQFLRGFVVSANLRNNCLFCYFT